MNWPSFISFLQINNIYNNFPTVPDANSEIIGDTWRRRYFLKINETSLIKKSNAFFKIIVNAKILPLDLIFTTSLYIQNVELIHANKTKRTNERKKTLWISSICYGKCRSSWFSALYRFSVGPLFF